MASFSNYWRNKILDHAFGKSAYTPPTIYIGLSTAEPLSDESGLSEPVGNGYARIATAASDWNVASGGEINNSNLVQFPDSTGSWGTVTHFVLFDAPTGGSMLVYGALSEPVPIPASQVPVFEAETLSITLH